MKPTIRNNQTVRKSTIGLWFQLFWLIISNPPRLEDYGDVRASSFAEINKIKEERLARFIKDNRPSTISIISLIISLISIAVAIWRK